MSKDMTAAGGALHRLGALVGLGLAAALTLGSVAVPADRALATRQIDDAEISDPAIGDLGTADPEADAGSSEDGDRPADEADPVENETEPTGDESGSPDDEPQASEGTLEDGTADGTVSDDIADEAPAVDSSSEEAITLDQPIAAAGSWCKKGERWMRPECPYADTFADPTILPVQERGGTVYYAFGTTTSQLRLPILKSSDLKSWKPATYTSNPDWQAQGWPGTYKPREDAAIPSEIRAFTYANEPNQQNATYYNVDGLVSPRPSWATDMGPTKMGSRGWNRQENWAPAVAKVGDRYFAYTALRVLPAGAAGAAPDGRFCITVAMSGKPGGPYRYPSGGAKKITCNEFLGDPGGAIDPEIFQYQGTWYLIWKGQGKPNVAQGLYAQPINTTTGELTGKRVELLTRITRGKTWETSTIENPSMTTIGSTTYLAYAGGDYEAKANNTSNYATGYAICPKGPTAPCSRPSGSNVLMSSKGDVQGPGGGAFFTAADGSVKFVYHAYKRGDIQGRRTMRVTNVHRWPDGSLSMSDGAKPLFRDVPSSHKFYSQIKWLASKGITTGTKAGYFRPSSNVSRADMAAFLYRYAGKPSYTPVGPSPFADLKSSDQFYKEIRWMYDRKMTTGSKNPKGGKPLFRPKDSISREAMAAFLYRFSGTKSYTPKGSQPLADITPSSKFYREIRWMYDNGITTGKKVGNKVVYDPYGSTKRDAFAAFLQRYDRKFG